MNAIYQRKISNIIQDVSDDYTRAASSYRNMGRQVTSTKEVAADGDLNQQRVHDVPPHHLVLPECGTDLPDLSKLFILEEQKYSCP